MPGEQEDMEVGVVSLLLHGPVEPECCVDGLPTAGRWGVEVAAWFKEVAAANALNSGISAGGRSPERLFDSMVGSIGSDGPPPRKAAVVDSWRSPGRDLELCFSMRSPFKSVRRFVYDSGSARLETYCSTEGAFRRKTLRVLSRPRGLSLAELDGVGRREVVGCPVTGCGGLEVEKLSRRVVKGLLVECDKIGRSSLIFPRLAPVRTLSVSESLVAAAGEGVVSLFRDDADKYSPAGCCLVDRDTFCVAPEATGTSVSCCCVLWDMYVGFERVDSPAT
jgi:hypothetical protein